MMIWLVSLLACLNSPALEWHTDYFAAYRKAEASQKDLFVYFCYPTETPAKKTFEQALENPTVKETLSRYVCVRIPLHFQIDGKELIQHPSMQRLLGVHGFVIVNLSRPDAPNYRLVTSIFPFTHLGGRDAEEANQGYQPFEPWTVPTFLSILHLPGTTLEERDMALASSPIAQGTIHDLVPNPSCLPLDPGEREVIRLTNVLRRACNLALLIVHPGLVEDARSHSGRMGNGLGLQHSNRGAENIAPPYFRTAQDAVNAWYYETNARTDGHRRNMLNPSYRFIGVGGFGSWWCQRFQ